MIRFKALASSSAGCCYVVESGTLPPLLIDAGIRFELIQEALNFQIGSLAGALISHAHGDHVKAARRLMANAVDCYAAKETWQQTGFSGHRAKVVDPQATVKVGPWSVLGFNAVHDVAGTMGFIVADNAGGKLLYLTDSAYSLYTFKGLTVMAVEANWSEELMRENSTRGEIHRDRAKRTVRTHMSIERLETMILANKADNPGLEEIHLLHLSDANSDEAAFKEAVQKATGIATYVAQKGAAV